MSSARRARKIAPQLTVVGGFYREICRFPPSDHYWGSGGRAAAAVAKSVLVRFVTAADEHARLILESIATAIGFEVQATRIPQTIRFQYDHGLSPPTIWPLLSDRDRMPLPAEGECVLQFGMLDAEPQVDGRAVIYDPQNPFAPEHLRISRRPSRLAYVMNEMEARRLGNADSMRVAARNLARDSDAHVIVIKRGVNGALVYDGKRFATVPAYASRRTWPIGSGDVFAAVFADRWGVKRLSPLRAADIASRATAEYVEKRTLPIRFSDLRLRKPIHTRRTRLGKNDYHVYVAGPFFNMQQEWVVHEARAALLGMGLKVFSPLHDIGIGPADEVAPKDIAALEKSRAIFAIVDGADAGTVFEVGFARALGTPVIAFAQSSPTEQLTMITGSGCEVVDDFVSAIYRTAWAALR